MERPISPHHPARPSGDKDAHDKSGLTPKDAPLKERYGNDSGADPGEVETPRTVTEDTDAAGSGRARQTDDPSHS